MCEYQKTFKKFQKVFKEETFCNEACRGRNVKISPSSDAIFVAMVGPPARGKSATFAFLQRYFAKYNRSVYLFNAGDYRRVWEKQVKKIYKKNVDGFINMCYEKKLANQGALQPHRLTLMKWLKSTQPAIPGEVFSSFKNLNNEFASVCIKDAMEYMEKGKVVVLDATNTDIARREFIISQFKEVKNPSRKLLFVENICFSEKQLKGNFMSKLLESSDYKGQVRQDCGSMTDNLPNIIKKIIENYDLLDMPCQKFNTKSLTPCEATVLESMKDITTRDMGYLTKYVPMHVSKKGSKSTVYTIKRNKSKDIGYIQIVNMVCLKDNHSSIYKTNLKAAKDKMGIAEYLVSVKVTDEENASSYGQEERIKVNPESLNHLL